MSGADSPLGEVQLGVRDEHHRDGGHSPGNAREQAAPAHHWARCGSVCEMSTTGVEATHRATRGSRWLTVTVARHEDGEGGLARRWSKAVAVLRGTACGLDEIRRGGRVPVPGNWLNELFGVQGVFCPSVGCSSSKNGGRKGRGDGGDRHSLKSIATKRSGGRGPMGRPRGGGAGAEPGAACGVAKGEPRVALLEAAVRAHGRGGLVNRGGRRGAV
jgi:hypothetical protein